MPIKGRFKSYFFRGLAVLLPTILTIAIFVWGYGFIRKYIALYINKAIVDILIWIQDLNPEAARPELEAFWINGLGHLAGFIIALIAVLIVGATLASVVGRTLWRLIEKFILNTPLLRRVYPYVKQITDFFLTEEEQKKRFSRVVAVEYPRDGIWSVGLVTGSGIKKISETVQKEFLTVLIPNSPTPVTGYVIVVPKELTISLDMTIEEAFRFIVSAGVITPQDKKLSALTPEKSNKQNKNTMLSEHK
ncbi:MAG: DUF502 domain-containing protein [Planctomycetota bacterium]|jgi:uncharacterized membrane protein